MKKYVQLLSKGDLRSIGNVNKVVKGIQNQGDFNHLVNLLEHPNRVIVMRAADAIEKVTRTRTELLHKHKKPLVSLARSADQKELKWHLALLLPRLPLTTKETGWIWELLTGWALDKTNSRIVRVNALQGLYEITRQHPALIDDLLLTFEEAQRWNIPSINARVRILKKKIERTLIS